MSFFSWVISCIPPNKNILLSKDIIVCPFLLDGQLFSQIIYYQWFFNKSYFHKSLIFSLFFVPPKIYASFYITVIELPYLLNINILSIY